MKRQGLFLISASVAALATLEPASAQESGDAAANGSYDTIVVTGQKRAENIQDVPVSVTAVSGEDLHGKAITRFDELQFAAPGLTIVDAGLTQSVNIRGVGLASGSPNVSNGVATYVDGVFQPPIVSTNSFYDVGSIEVFRGPQGTFVGSNSTGGAIFINSRNPDLDGFGGYLETTLGNYDAVGVESAVNVPLVKDVLAVRGAVLYRKRDSYYDNVGPAIVDPASLDEIAGRVGVLFEPNDAISSLTKVEIVDRETGGYAYRPILGTLYAPFRTSDIRLLDYDDPTRNDEKNFQATERLDFDLGSVTLRSVTGYQNKRIYNLYDTDATSSTTLPRRTSDQFVQEKVYTQEINLISTDDSDLSWIVGGYFQRNNITIDISQRSNGFPTDIEGTNRKTTWGGFAQVSYAFSPSFSVDVGGRYSTFDITGEGGVFIGRGIPMFPPSGVMVADIGGAESDSKFTGKVAFNWNPTDGHLVYAFVARGYKSGGFASQTSTFVPETVLNYEVGWKGTFADGRIVTQLDAFYSDYNNFQFDVLDPSVGRSGPTNLTDAKIKGVEGQIYGKFGNLKVDTGFAFVDSSLSGVDFVDVRAFNTAFPGVNTAPQCPTGMPSMPPTCIDYTPFFETTAGGPNLYSPKWTFNIGGEYEFDLGWATFTPRLNYAYVGDQWAYIGYNTITDLLEARGILSALATFRFDRFSVEFYGRNLADKEYVTGQSGGVNEFYGPPREYGARLRVDF